MAKTLNERIAEIRDELIKSFPEKAAKISSLATKLYADTWDDEAAKALKYQLHNLRGLSGSHGLLVIHELATNAEEALTTLIDKNTALNANQKTALQNLIGNLTARMTDVNKNYSNIHAIKKDTETAISTSKAPLILIVDDDQNFCYTLALQLEHLGYRTRSIFNLDELEESIRVYKPQAIFMDIIFNGDHDAGTKIIKVIHEKEELTCPIIYMSACDDMKARLDAIRNEGVAFLSKNFNLGDLKNIVDLIIPLKKDSAYKVLIVDDDKISSEYCASILEHAGIKVTCLNKPEEIFEYIVNFDPDVILLDMYMPNINGFEMAGVIRQHQNFSAIPIVIMSGETDINKQFKMRRAGADDFILKPFKPHHLVDTIINRIQRSKQTKHLIYTDGLTGLMIFSKVKEQIINLLDSCVRYNLDFSIALIDLDLFKNVNDTYGHLTGDQILRNFSEFLLARVRKSDLVTRSGGEEFTLIFPYTTAENAARALNTFREAFSQRIQHSHDKEFKVTFSAGIANIKHHQDLESLLAAADRALYVAKAHGRNRIEIAD